MSGEENNQATARISRQGPAPEQSVQNLSDQQVISASAGFSVGSQQPVHPEIIEPIGPPPAYQEIYPDQPHYWNGQPWPPPPPPPLPLRVIPGAPVHHPLTPPRPWTIQTRTVTYYNRSPRTFNSEHQTIVARPKPMVRWFFGTITCMMIFSIVSAFVYVLIVTANVE